MKTFALDSDIDDTPPPVAKYTRRRPDVSNEHVEKAAEDAVVLDDSSDISGDHEAPPPTGRPLQNGSAAQTTMRSQAEGGSGQQQETGNTRPRRNAKRAAAADANNCVQGNDFFMPTTKKKRKAAEQAKRRLAEEAEAKAVEEQAAAEAAAATKRAREDAAAQFQKQLKASAEENAKLSAGLAPHPFLMKRAARAGGATANDGAPCVKRVTELTTPPMPPVHVAQLPGGEAAYTCAATATFQLRPGDLAEGNDSDAASVPENIDTSSFALCWPSSSQQQRQHQHFAHHHSSAQHPGKEQLLQQAPQPLEQGQHQRQRSLLETLAEYLADAGRPSCDARVDLEDHPTAAHHLERLRGRLNEVMAQRDTDMCDVSLSPEAAPATDVGGADRGAAAAAHALWTERYQPRRPAQVCGNTDAVVELQKWLTAWQEASTGAAVEELRTTPPPGVNRKRGRGQALMSGSDWEEDPEDVGSSDENGWGAGRAASNVVMLTGPVGCGKTAAAYAVAVASKYRVIEINTSTNRTGAHVLRLVGEATQSQRVSLAAGAAAAEADAGTAQPPPPSKPASKFFGKHQAEPNKDSHSQEDGKAPAKGRNLPPPATIKKQPLTADARVEKEGLPLTLLLFEEVDNLQDEDRGFMTALQHLVFTSKCPIIMTANQAVRDLPARQISFARPSAEEVVEQLALIQTAENAMQVPLSSLQRLVSASGSDLRQSIQMAQLLRGCDSPPGIDAIVDAARIEDRCPAAAEVAHLLQGCAQSLSTAASALANPAADPAAQVAAMVAAAQPLTLAAEADLLRPVEDVKGPDSFDAPAPTPSTLTFGFGWQPSPAQLRLRDDCSRWAEVARAALDEGSRVAVCSLRDAGFERMATFRGIAAVQRMLRSSPGSGRSRRRGHRNYFEDSLALAPVAAAELTACPETLICAPQQPDNMATPQRVHLAA